MGLPFGVFVFVSLGEGGLKKSSILSIVAKALLVFHNQNLWTEEEQLITGDRCSPQVLQSNDISKWLPDSLLLLLSFESYSTYNLIS